MNEFIEKNIYFFLMFVVYTMLLIYGTKNIIEHNTKIKMCKDMGMIPIVGEECITDTEYQNRLALEDSLNWNAKRNQNLSRVINAGVN